MGLPDLAGQPPWVVITVVVLTVLGTLGVAWLRRGNPDPDSDAIDQGNSANVPLESGAHDAVLVVGKALDHLAEVARREALESDSERAEARLLRQRLDECEDMVEKLRRNGGER
jgi:hypothetical protein